MQLNAEKLDNCLVVFSGSRLESTAVMLEIKSCLKRLEYDPKNDTSMKT